MNELETRMKLVTKVEVDGHGEPDYIDSAIYNIELPSLGVYMITEATAHRPDLISYMFYRTYHFAWMIHLHNDVVCPFSYYEAGKIISIPDISRYYRYFNRNARMDYEE